MCLTWGEIGKLLTNRFHSSANLEFMWKPRSNRQTDKNIEFGKVFLINEEQDLWVFFTLFPKITQVCVKVNCYIILCKNDEVFTQSSVGVLTFYTMLCKNVNLYTGLCNDSISCICDKFYTNLCNFTQSCVSLH